VAVLFIARNFMLIGAASHSGTWEPVWLLCGVWFGTHQGEGSEISTIWLVWWSTVKVRSSMYSTVSLFN